MHRFDYHRPRTLADAMELKGLIGGSRYVAGGTDLIVRIKDGLLRPAALISLRSVEELAKIDVNAGARIGAMSLLEDLIAHPVIRERYPVLVQALSTVGSVQIRNAGTIGGNLCNAAPCADSAPPLLVLEATLCITGATGQRRVPVQDYFVAPNETRLGDDEIVTAIEIDPQPTGARGLFLKKRRVWMDLALASVAVLLELEADGRTCRKARIAAGSVAPTPLRLGEAERLLEGNRITEGVLDLAVDRARESISPISDVRTSADYRRHVTGVLLRRAMETLMKGLGVAGGS